MVRNREIKKGKKRTSESKLTHKNYGLKKETT